MLQLNLKPLFAARGIEQPFSFLRKAGFTHNTAHKLLSNPRTLHLNYIELICAALNCLPNDILEYSPGADGTLPAGHLLHKLEQRAARGNLAKELRSLPPEDLEKIWGLMDDLKKADAQHPTGDQHNQPT